MGWFAVCIPNHATQAPIASEAMALTNTTETRPYSIMAKRTQAPKAEAIIAITKNKKLKMTLFNSMKVVDIALLIGTLAKRLIFRQTHPKCLTEILTRLLCCLSISLASTTGGVAERLKAPVLKTGNGKP